MLRFVWRLTTKGSLLLQTLRGVNDTLNGLDCEIIVADDASTDDSITLAQAEFPTLRVVRFESRQGASPTKHLAALAATGDTLIFLDAHCKPEPGALRRLVEGVEVSAGRSIYTPTLIGLDADTFEPIPAQVGHGYRVDLSTLHCYWVSLESLQRWPETQAYRQPALIGCCVAVSREAYFRCGGFDADMRVWGVEDIDFGLKADRLGYQLCLDPLARVAHRFQAAFTHYGVPSAEVQHNRLRMAWKHYSLGHLEQWLVYNTPFLLVDLTDPTRLETPDPS